MRHLLVGPRHDRSTARLAGLALNQIVGFVGALRPGDADEIESASRYRNLAAGIEFVRAVAAVKVRHGAVGGKADHRLIVEIDDPDQRAYCGQRGGAGRVEVGNCGIKALAAAAYEPTGDKERSEPTTHRQTVSPIKVHPTEKAGSTGTASRFPSQ